MEQEEAKCNGECENDTAQTRSKRHVKPQSKYDDYELYMAFDVVSFIEDVPKIYYDLEHRPDKVLWEETMKRELDSINKNNTWEIVEKPKDTKMLDTKWVHALKPIEHTKQKGL
ncbi:form3 [Trypoxylus dichotomus]